MADLSELSLRLAQWNNLTKPECGELCVQIIERFDRPDISIAEIADLARGLAASGTVWNWPKSISPRSDTPSTGGGGSLTTLVCPYIIAACGCYVPKVSVPGSVAGAIDTLTLLPGFQDTLDYAGMRDALENCRIGHSRNTKDMAPADGTLFTIRSDLGKKSIPSLVIASLLSKKLAAGCDTSVFDIRIGPTGNLGTTRGDAEAASRRLIDVAESLGFAVTCVLTDHSIPRIPCFGRSESLYLLHQLLIARGRGDVASSLVEHFTTCLQIAAEAIMLCGISSTIQEANGLCETAVYSGDALRVFHAHLSAQHTVPGALKNRLETLSLDTKIDVLSQHSGYISAIDTGKIFLFLRTENLVDAGWPDAFGIWLVKSVGDKVNTYDVVLQLRTSDIVSKAKRADYQHTLQPFFAVSEDPPISHTSELISVLRP